MEPSENKFYSTELQNLMKKWCVPRKGLQKPIQQVILEDDKLSDSEKISKIYSLREEHDRMTQISARNFVSSNKVNHLKNRNKRLNKRKH